MGKAALEYHRKTSYDRHDMGGIGLDWANQPNVFKAYPGFQTVPLPQVTTEFEENLSFLIRGGPRADTARKVTLDKLAEIILLAHSITAKARHAGTAFYYRNVASAGALYPFELYAGVRSVSGLDDGLYHHTLGLHALTVLRSGNIMGALYEAIETGDDVFPVAAFFLTSIFFRSSWKYRDRAYRYNLLDTGHLAENLSLALRAQGLPFKLYYDFDDAEVNDLLGVDPHREGCLVVVCVWGKDGTNERRAQGMQTAAENLRSASRVSNREVDYSLIKKIHGLSSRVVRYGQGVPNMLYSLGLRMKWCKEVPKADHWPEVMNYTTAVLKRRSRRNFVPTQLSLTGFAGLLELLCVGCNEPEDVQLAPNKTISIGFLSGNIEELDPGFYMLDRQRKSMALVSEGFMVDKMAHICLNQRWLADCALHFVFLSDLELLEQTWGPRGYRYAMLTAGRLGQRIYLGATAMGLGCCGIGAFFDREAAELLGVKDQTKLLYLVGSGPLKH